MVTAFRVLVLIIGIAGALPAPASAQIPGFVRVVAPGSPILRWLGPAPRDVLFVVDPGVVLEVLDREDRGDGWYWVITPRDAHGSRRVGWIAAGHVEPAPPPVRAPVAAVPPDDEARAARGDERDAPAARMDDHPLEVSDAGIEAGPSRREFEDVVFERDRSALGPAAISALDAVVAAMSSDRLLKLTIEGHTCTLGTAPYNLSLGHRRAAAVRDYFVTQGVEPDRLRTVSHGAERPRHDNAREETRRLNRRVVLVADQ